MAWQDEHGYDRTFNRTAQDRQVADRMNAEDARRAYDRAASPFTSPPVNTPADRWGGQVSPSILPTNRPATFDFRQSNGQSYITPGAFREFRLRMIFMIFGMLGALAGYNAYRKLGLSKVQATIHGTYCAMRWKVWAWTAFQFTALTVIWIFWAYLQQRGALVGYTDGVAVYDPQDNSFTIMLLLINLAIFIPAVGVTYCQNIDESLFRKRLAYRLLLPFHRTMGRTPWFFLHTVSLLPLIVMAMKYNI
jgi:hypothetical protein